VTDPEGVKDVDDLPGEDSEESARVVVRLATLDADGPTGPFQDENGPVPW
jgi:hypothetical protein